MRKLDRSAVPAPPCLANYKHGVHTWKDAEDDRPQIRAHLEQLQGRRCAYCEGDLDALGQHIEHFRSRSRFPKLTFEWANLFWSCSQDDSCGHYKDAKGRRYQPEDLVNPCVDDPDKYFRFRSNGTIDLRPGLSEKDQKRARETLRVFNLDPEHGRLRSMRERAIKSYRKLEPNILDTLMEFDPLDRAAFIAAEVARTAGDPFCTVIRHYFEDVK